MSLVIVNSGGANIASIIFAFERIGVTPHYTDDIDTIQSADRVVLPGVGAAKDAIQGLKNKGLIPVIKSLTQPVFGICLGMQLLFDHSEEGGTEMLGLIPAKVAHFKPGVGKTIPHIGWNNVSLSMDHPLTHGLKDESYFYFVHSYCAQNGDYTVGACDYMGEVFTAIAAKDNVMGCQFHPERSAEEGLQILKNFMELKL